MVLHPKTKVQRARKAHAAGEAHYEKADAPPGKALAVGAIFFAIVVIGLMVAAGTIEWRDARHGIVMRDPAAPVFVNASLPPLLADPVQNRREVEAEARGHLDPAKLEAAMEQVERENGSGKR